MGNNGLFNLIPLVLFIILIAAGWVALRKGHDGYQSSLAVIPAFNAGTITSETLAGKTAIVNFFASWCTPCEAEHPVLMTLSENASVYGISFMDRKKDTDDFLNRLGNPFSITGHDENGIAAVAWGVQGVPTTFVIKDGHIAYRHDMPLTYEDIDKILAVVRAR